MPAKVILTIIAGNLTGQGFIFETRNTCILGRAHDCHPHLPDDQHHRTVSRYHCLLDINPPAIRIRDFGSLNGTYINGQLIGRRHPETTPEQCKQMYFPECDLQAGDEITLGSTVFRVDIEGIDDNEATQRASSLPEQLKLLVPPANDEKSDLVAIQGYTILRLLGRGGYGAVYLARHDETGKKVALKTLLPQIAHERGMVDQFLREVENTKALDHQNIVQLKDSKYDCENNRFFFTLNYCEGGSVADLLQQQRQPLSIDEALPIVLQALDGLAYAHNALIPNIKQWDDSFGEGRGLVHRDIKPANLLLTTSVDGNRTTKIGDYGLAKAFDLAGLSGQTRTGAKAGTPRFMPRQQVINFKYVKPEVDIWSLAASFYYMLTLHYPRTFMGGDPYQVVLQTDAVPICQREPSIPKQLGEVIDLALVDRPEIYFKDALSFKQELLNCM